MALFKGKKHHSDRTERSEFMIGDDHKVVFNSSELIPVVIQNDMTSEVLRLGYLNKWALQMSLDEKKVFIFRRSLQSVEVFGEKQGIEWEISAIHLSRNRRSILFKVVPSGRAHMKSDGDFQAETKEIKSDFLHIVYSNKKWD